MIQTIYKRMKIVVSLVSSTKGNKHLIQVVDHNSVVHSETTDTIDKRDALVWALAETYNVLDIEVKHNDPSKEYYDEHGEFRFSEIPSIPVLDEQDAEAFFDDHENLVYSRILRAVEEGILMDLDEIRLFELSGTGVYLTSERADWKNGLEKAIQYFVSLEDYEKCITSRQLLSKL
jgi:hypothetical protein